MANNPSQPKPAEIGETPPNTETGLTQSTAAAPSPVAAPQPSAPTPAAAPTGDVDAEVEVGHDIPEEVHAQIDLEVATEYAHHAEVFPSPEAYREYLLACYIVSLYPQFVEASETPALRNALEEMVGGGIEVRKAKEIAQTVYDPHKQYIVAHNAVGDAKQGDTFVGSPEMDMQRLLDLGAIEEA